MDNEKKWLRELGYRKRAKWQMLDLSGLGAFSLQWQSWAGLLKDLDSDFLDKKIKQYGSLKRVLLHYGRFKTTRNTKGETTPAQTRYLFLDKESLRAMQIDPLADWLLDPGF